MKKLTIFSSVIGVLLLSSCASLHIGEADLEGIPEHPQTTWTVIDGQVYGARPDSTGPIGGGEGYQNIISASDPSVTAIVSSTGEMLTALAEAREGDVIFVPGNLELNFTGEAGRKVVIEIPAGVTLASDRGYQGSSGAVLFSYVPDTQPLIRALGPNVRITGLRIEGPDKSTQRAHHLWSYTDLSPREAENNVGRLRYYALPISVGIYTEENELEVDNCELWGWDYAAINLVKGMGHHIHHNYIHHNQRLGLGYGINHDTAFSLIEFNLFAKNRHSIAGSGHLPSGYIARNNVVLSGSAGHAFDMHGPDRRPDGSIIAGSWMIIENNTFYESLPAIGIRGKPEEETIIRNNWFFWNAMSAKTLIYWPPAETINIQENAFGARP